MNNDSSNFSKQIGAMVIPGKGLITVQGNPIGESIPEREEYELVLN